MVLLQCIPQPRLLLRRSINGRSRSPATVLLASAASDRDGPPGRILSVEEARASLVLALASQAFSMSLRRFSGLAEEASKYLVPRTFEARNLEEALMSVPDLETIKYRVLKRRDLYEIREVEPYFVAETTMPGQSAFDFNGSSESFNILAAYLFGKNTRNESRELTTPVFTQKSKSSGEKMDMTTPVITKRSAHQEKWKMSFVMPSKYGSKLPLPKDPSVTIREVTRKIVAVSAFSGFVTDRDVSHRESKLREDLRSDSEFRVKGDALVEVAQFNPPFTLPFTRRNEISVEVERI